MRYTSVVAPSAPSSIYEGVAWYTLSLVALCTLPDMMPLMYRYTISVFSFS